MSRFIAGIGYVAVGPDFLALRVTPYTPNQVEWQPLR
jgi:hypothetical protein